MWGKLRTGLEAGCKWSASHFLSWCSKALSWKSAVACQGKSGCCNVLPLPGRRSLLPGPLSPGVPWPQPQRRWDRPKRTITALTCPSARQRCGAASLPVEIPRFSQGAAEPALLAVFGDAWHLDPSKKKKKKKGMGVYFGFLCALVRTPQATPGLQHLAEGSVVLGWDSVWLFQSWCCLDLLQTPCTSPEPWQGEFPGASSGGCQLLVGWPDVREAQRRSQAKAQHKHQQPPALLGQMCWLGEGNTPGWVPAPRQLPCLPTGGNSSSFWRCKAP